MTPDSWRTNDMFHPSRPAGYVSLRTGAALFFVDRGIITKRITYPAGNESISHPGKRKRIFKSTFKRGYVSSQEDTTISSQSTAILITYHLLSLSVHNDPYENNTHNKPIIKPKWRLHCRSPGLVPKNLLKGSLYEAEYREMRQVTASIYTIPFVLTLTGSMFSQEVCFLIPCWKPITLSPWKINGTFESVMWIFPWRGKPSKVPRSLKSSSKVPITDLSFQRDRRIFRYPKKNPRRFDVFSLDLLGGWDPTNLDTWFS